MTDFVDTLPFLKKTFTNRLPWQPCILTYPKLVYLWGFFFTFRGSQGLIFTSSKLSLGCKVGQIRSRGRWFEAELSLFMMIFVIFILSIRLSLIFLNFSNEVISYTTTR